MTDTTFSALLRERSWTRHGESEGASFMHDLMTGKGSKEDYIALVVQHYFVYEAIEAAASRLADDPVAAPFLDDALTRLPAIEADLEHLIGPDWRDEIAPVRSVVEYVSRINEVADEGWAGGFVAHHYTRYLGDLSGGQAIKRLMQRQFDLDDDGVRFYIFDDIESPKDFKDAYRAKLDSAPWSVDEANRVIDEVIAAYDFNTRIFEDLSALKAAV